MGQSELVARQRFTQTPNEVRTVTVGFKDLLESGELLTGTVTVTPTPATMTCASPIRNASSVVIDGETYLANQAIQFSASAGVEGQVYLILISVATNGSPAQTFNRYIYIEFATPGTVTDEATEGGDYYTLLQYIGDYLGKSLDPDSWTQNEYDRISNMVNAGYRQYLHPACLPGERNAHEWSFLRPLTTMTIWGTITGTVTGAPTYSSSTLKSTITASTNKFFSNCVGKTFQFDTSENEYTITDYTSATSIKVSGNASGETSGDTFTIEADGDYTLPYDFGGIYGQMYYSEDDDAWFAVTVTGEGHILNRRQSDSSGPTTFGMPDLAAIVPINSSTTTRSQRHRLMTWPTPAGGSTYTLKYRYHALQNELSATNPFALGCPAHFETLLSSCLSKAELLQNDAKGIHWDTWMERLKAAIDHDRRRTAPEKYGYNGDNSGRKSNDGRRWLQNVTFDGILYEGT